jgi:putative mRNA 3-end processing factor
MRRDRVGWLGGVLVDTGKARWLFDPTVGHLGEGRTVFVTHAHSDHTRGLSARSAKYSTRETYQLYEALTERRVHRWHPLRVNDSVRFDDVDVTALNAGHILGSCQFKVSSPEFTAIYTGDLNCVDTLTTKAAQPEPCDYLIIEATYGHPSYLFPPRSAVYADIIRWTMSEIMSGMVPTFQVYSSGKPQEMVKLFNDYTKIPVVCSSTISRTNRVYVKNGVKLKYLDTSTSAGARRLKTGGCVHLTTSRHGQFHPKASRAVTTGWALTQPYRTYASFPLSSHADYDQLLHFIAECHPKKVYAFTGHAEALITQVRRRLGIDASTLPQITQTKLFDFYGKPFDDYEEHSAPYRRRQAHPAALGRLPKTSARGGQKFDFRGGCKA